MSITVNDFNPVLFSEILKSLPKRTLDPFIEECWAEGLRVAERLRCPHCSRWFRSKRGKSIHLFYCKNRKVHDAMMSIRKLHPLVIYSTRNDYHLTNLALENQRISDLFNRIQRTVIPFSCLAFYGRHRYGMSLSAMKSIEKTFLRGLQL